MQYNVVWALDNAEAEAEVKVELPLTSAPYNIRARDVLLFHRLRCTVRLYLGFRPGAWQSVSRAHHVTQRSRYPASPPPQFALACTVLLVGNKLETQSHGICPFGEPGSFGGGLCEAINWLGMLTIVSALILSVAQASCQIVRAT